MQKGTAFINSCCFSFDLEPTLFYTIGQLQSDFPHLEICAGNNRTQTTQALIQMGVLLMTLSAAIIGGALTGRLQSLAVKLAICQLSKNKRCC